ncbi:MAG: hypothetical protein Aurels2KO_06940 [Aureliella sp.]
MLSFNMQINALMSAYASYAPRSLGARVGTARGNETPAADNAKRTAPAITDTVSFSDEALAQVEAAELGRVATAPNTPAASQAQQAQGPKPPPPRDEEVSTTDSGSELSEEEQQQVDELKARDREVRQHEQAHVSAGGGHVTGGPTYSYQRGPDGKRYAIGGEVQIDTSPVEGDPEATAQKARVVRAAALAPAEPSGQDLRVAANATKMEQEAVAQIRQASNVDSDSAEFARSTYGAQAPEQPKFLNVVA